MKQRIIRNKVGFTSLIQSINIQIKLSILISVHPSVCVQSSQPFQLSSHSFFLFCYTSGITGQCGGRGGGWRGCGEVQVCVLPTTTTSLPSSFLHFPPSVAVARRAVITLVSALLGATPPPARGGGHP